MGGWGVGAEFFAQATARDGGRYDSREGGGRARQEHALESNAGSSCRMRKRGSPVRPSLTARP